MKEKEQHRVQFIHNDMGISIEQYSYEPGFFRFNWHNSYEILVVLKGRITVYVDGISHILEEDDIILINPLAGHATTLIDVSSVILLTHLSSEYFNKVKNQSPPIFQCLSNTTTKHTPPYAALRHYIASIYTELSNPNNESLDITQGSIQLLYGLLSRYFSTHKPSISTSPKTLLHTKKVEKILTYIENHYTEKLSLQMIASSFNMNHTYLSSYFHSRVGITFYEYLTRLRLRQAIYLLNNTKKPILHIALDSGFPDAKSLNQCFYHYFQTSPSQYRNSLNKHLYDKSVQVLPIYFNYSHTTTQLKVNEYLNMQ